MVIGLIPVIKLLRVKLTHPGYGIGTVHALDGSLLILIGIAPRYRLRPVDMRSYRITVSVLLDYKILIPSVSRIGKTFTDDGITHPKHKLLVFCVCNLRLIHPESIHRHTFGIGFQVPQRIILGWPHLH